MLSSSARDCAFHLERMQQSAVQPVGVRDSSCERSARAGRGPGGRAGRAAGVARRCVAAEGTATAAPAG